jgi:DnaJ-class molecular chaperone
MSTNMPFYTHNIPPVLSYLEIKKSDDKIISIDCSLEELYYGCIKKYSLERLIIGRQNGTTKKIKENIEISIKKGYKDGTRITYSKKGDENINKITGDVVFIVKELVHDKYKRFNKNDLMITKDITLSDVTNGFTFSVKCINGVEKDIIINPKEIVNSKCMYKIDGYGMPIRNNGNVLNKCDTEYGNLYVEFNIIFE